MAKGFRVLNSAGALKSVGATGAAGATGATGAAGAAADEQVTNNKFPTPMYRRTLSLVPSFETASTFYGINIGAGITAAGTNAVLSEADFVGRRFTTAATTGTTAGFNTLSKLAETLLDPIFWCRVRTGSSITNVRIWVGIATQNLGNQDSVATSHIAAFRYSTVAGDGGWVGVTQAASAAFTVTGTVAAIAADTEYLLRIRVTGDGTSISFSVDDGAEQTSTTDLPDTASNVLAVVKIATQENAAKYIDFASLYAELSAMTRNMPDPL